MRPLHNSSLPDVSKAVWVTRPPDLANAARPDENVAKVHVELFMPLFLQLVSQQADVGSAIKLQALVLWQTISVAFYAIGLPCRSACMRERQAHLTIQTA